MARLLCFVCFELCELQAFESWMNKKDITVASTPPAFFRKTASRHRRRRAHPSDNEDTMCDAFGIPILTTQAAQALPPAQTQVHPVGFNQPAATSTTPAWPANGASFPSTTVFGFVNKAFSLANPAAHSMSAPSGAVEDAMVLDEDEDEDEDAHDDGDNDDDRESDSDEEHQFVDDVSELNPANNNAAGVYDSDDDLGDIDPIMERQYAKSLSK
jgi:hypothetical protein